MAKARLLHPIAEYGHNPHENLLIEGDALYALTALGQMPEYRDRYLGTVKLVTSIPRPIPAQRSPLLWDNP